MALKTLMLRRDVDLKRRELTGLQAKREELEAKRAELEAAIAEVETDEQRDAVNAEVEAFEAEDRENAEKVGELERQIADLESELKEAEAAQETPAPVPEERTDNKVTNPEKRGERTMTMDKRNIFSRMQLNEVNDLFTREDVKSFAANLREMGKQKRSISGGDLTIPEVLLPLMKEQVEANAKLLKFVNLQHVAGTSRMPIMGTIPEAVWTEMCANLNELDLAFNDVEMDGYKVGAYVPVCNALLEDNDVNLVGQVLFALGRAIAIALDKAILYGTGTKMPLGIVTRLAQTAEPATYPATARTWVDLHTTNIQKITAANSTGITLFQKILEIFGNASGKYSTGAKFWAMNSKTHMALVGEAMNFNAAGAIVAGVNNTMPAIGGEIVELDFMADNNIVAGYGDEYVLAERAGTKIGSSEHFLFTSDKTVFKGTARYDGQPAIAEGFVAIGIKNTDPATTATFASDTANT